MTTRLYKQKKYTNIFVLSRKIDKCNNYNTLHYIINVLLYTIVIFIIFVLDRLSKLYILNLAETNSIVDVYINSLLNFYLVWNKGLGFGLFSFDQNIIYNFITLLIILINILIIFMIYKSYDFRVYFLLMVLGGSLGNLFARIYFRAVPDFIDLHYMNFHWFIFNVADIFISIGIICLILAEIFLNKDIKNEKK